MNKELIEKLKNNKVAWIFLSKEEQDCLIKVNKNAGVDNLKYNGEWENTDRPWSDISTGESLIWRIKPDYQPEPEYVDLEIVEHESGMWLGVYSDRPGMPYHFTHLHTLPSLPNFSCFWQGSEYSSGSTFVSIGLVATKMSERKPIYARFRI